MHKDLFVPYLANIFEGPYRDWYLMNKRRWSTWEDFAQAFCFQWRVRKDDYALFREVCNLKLEKSETLAEHACRVSILFNKMQNSPSFYDQLRHILKKFNPRLACEILNLRFNNYDEFLHYVNDRSYFYRQSFDKKKEPRGRAGRTELKNLQGVTDEDDTVQPTEDEDSDEQPANLNAIKQSNTANKKLNNSKSLTKQRLERNLARFEKDTKTSTSAPDGKTKTSQTKFVPDPTKVFCYNCGVIGHFARSCTAETQVICFICRTVGYKNKNCPMRSENDKAQQ